jgi:hypothetical protein
MPNITAKWLGHPIADPKHHEELEHKAGIKEFEEGLPQESAETATMHEYLLEQHLDGASHHMSQLRAHANQGNKALGNNHERMYKLHLGKLAQLDPHVYGKALNSGDTHPNITAKVKNDAKASDRYNSHKSDILLFNYGGPNDSSKKQ